MVSFASSDCRGRGRDTQASTCATPVRRAASAHASARRRDDARERLRIQARSRAIAEAVAVLQQASEKLIQISGKASTLAPKSSDSKSDGCGVLLALGTTGLALNTLSNYLEGGALAGLMDDDSDDEDSRVAKLAEAYQNLDEKVVLQKCASAWGQCASKLHVTAKKLDPSIGDLEPARPAAAQNKEEESKSHFFIGESEDDIEDAKTARTRRKTAPAAGGGSLLSPAQPSPAVRRGKRASLPARTADHQVESDALQPPSYHLFAGGKQSMDWPLSRAEMKSRLLVVDWWLSVIRYSQYEAEHA